MEQASAWAVIAATVIALIAFLFGIFQFLRTQALTRRNLDLQAALLEHEKEAKAIELFIRFNELKRATANTQLDPTDEAQFWQHNAAVALIESIHKITAGNEAWNETVRWMLERQTPFLEANPVDERTFAPGFFSIVKAAVPNIRVAKSVT